MISIKLFGRNDVRIVSEDIPEINENQALIKVACAAVCGTDVRSWMYGKDFVNENNPMTLGHEIAGVVVKKGKNVSEVNEGDRVCYVPCRGCGTCYYCTHGNTHQCDGLIACGINARGLMSEYVVADEKFLSQGNVFKIPDEVSFETAALCEPLSCVYNGFLMLDALPGMTALVIGAGPIGMMHSMLLMNAGIKVLICEKNTDRRNKAKEILEKAIVFEGEDLEKFVLENTDGRGVDIGITACPDPNAQTQILPLMAKNGRVHFFGGVPKEMQPVCLDTNIIHYKALRVVGSTCSNVWQYKDVLEMAGRGDIHLEKLVTARFDKNDALKAFENAKNLIGFKNIITF